MLLNSAVSFTVIVATVAVSSSGSVVLAVVGRCRQEKEHEWPPLNVMCDLGTSSKDKVGIGDLTGIVLRDTSPGNTVGEHDRRRSKGTSAKEPEERNEKDVRSKE
ncbi:hypothetical protein STEG23_023035, partial [Scotinomys teguina]